MFLVYHDVFMEQIYTHALGLKDKQIKDRKKEIVNWKIDVYSNKKKKKLSEIKIDI